MLFTEYTLADALEAVREKGREDVFDAARKVILTDAQGEIQQAEAQRQARYCVQVSRKSSARQALCETPPRRIYRKPRREKNYTP